jgi:hypothetical protein
MELEMGKRPKFPSGAKAGLAEGLCYGAGRGIVAGTPCSQTAFRC